MLIGRCFRLLIALILLTSLTFRGASLVSAEVPTDRPIFSGRIQYYFDSREFNTLNWTVGIRNLPLESHFFGYTNFNSRQGDSSNRFDLRETASEYRLTNNLIGRWLGLSGLGLFSEVNYASPGDRSIGRFGFSYKLRLPRSELSPNRSGWISFRAVPLETDGDGGQISTSYQLPILSRLFLNGFSDYNIRTDQPNRWLVESQLNLKVWGPLSIVVEFRYNGFFSDIPSKQSVGWAPGIRFDARF